MKDRSTFGTSLAELLRAKGISVKRLAEMTGYKSKTSIVRILRDESIHAGRERLFDQIDALGLLTPQERASLLRALESSRVGAGRMAARLRLRSLLCGEKASPGLSSALLQALEQLRAARAARILLLNGCHPALIEALSGILGQRPAHAMEHYVALDDSEERAVEALCAILSIAFQPAYACAILEISRGMPPPACQDMLCFSAQNRDGQSEDTLILFPGAGDVAIHRQPASLGLFDFCRDTIRGAGFRPAVSAHQAQESPEAIIEAMRLCTELERGCDVRVVKPDVCVNEVDGRFLREALVDGGVLRYFPGCTERQIRVHLEEFLFYQDLRFQNAFSGAHLRRQIMSARSLRHFALTGGFDSPFSAIRPFSVGERIAILENFERHMRADGEGPLRFWNVENDLAMEVHCFEGLGLIAFPARIAGTINVSFQTSIVRDQRLAALFRECFEDDLLRNCAMSAQESLRYVTGLLCELRAAP